MAKTNTNTKIKETLTPFQKAQAETAARESGEKAASVPPNPETMFNDLWGKDPVKATLYLIKQTKIGNMKYNPDHYNAISSKVKSLKARTIEAIISNKGKAFIYKEATDRMYDHYPTPDKVIADYKTDMEKHSQKLETEATEHAPREYQTYKDLGKLLKAYYQLNPELKAKPVEIDYSGPSDISFIAYRKADELRKELGARFPNAKVITAQTSPSVGCHVGPDEISFFFLQKDIRPDMN